MLWYDTGANILKMRSEADDAWINVGTLDQSANTFQANYTPPFTPVQQGGGIGQGSNKVYIGWSGSGLKVTVDSTDLGTVAFGTPTTYTDAQARTAQAGHSVGGIGSYAMLAILVNGSSTEGGTRAGSELGYSDANGISRSAGISGTWRCMGRASRTGTAPDPVIYNPGLWLRIA